MSNRLRRILAVSFAALLLSTSAMAQSVGPGDASNAPPVVDVMLLRPFGFISLVVGTAIFVVISPIILVTRPHEIGKPFNDLVGGPARYLWLDPLGGH
jgi:hypothetical protein